MASEATSDRATEWDDIEVEAVDIDDPNLDPIALGFASREDFDAFVQVGIDSVECDGVILHDVVMAEIDQLLADLAARRAAAR